MEFGHYLTNILGQPHEVSIGCFYTTELDRWDGETHQQKLKLDGHSEAFSAGCLWLPLWGYFSSCIARELTNQNVASVGHETSMWMGASDHPFWNPKRNDLKSHFERLKDVERGFRLRRGEGVGRPTSCPYNSSTPTILVMWIPTPRCLIHCYAGASRSAAVAMCSANPFQTSLWLPSKHSLKRRIISAQHSGLVLPRSLWRAFTSRCLGRGPWVVRSKWVPSNLLKDFQNQTNTTTCFDLLYFVVLICFDGVHGWTICKSPHISAIKELLKEKRPGARPNRSFSQQCLGWSRQNDCDPTWKCFLGGTGLWLRQVYGVKEVEGDDCR